MALVSLVTADYAPRGNGHYSHASVFEGLVFTAMQLPIDPRRPSERPGTLETQVRQVLSNIAAILEAAGSDLDAVLRITVYVTDIGRWPEVDRIYSEVMQAHKPPRGVIAVTGLHLGYDVAMDAIGAQLRGAS